MRTMMIEEILEAAQRLVVTEANPEVTFEFGVVRFAFNGADFAFYSYGDHIKARVSIEDRVERERFTQFTSGRTAYATLQSFCRVFSSNPSSSERMISNFTWYDEIGAFPQISSLFPSYIPTI